MPTHGCYCVLVLVVAACTAETTMVQTSVGGLAADGADANRMSLLYPFSVVQNSTGHLYISDRYGHVRLLGMGLYALCPAVPCKLQCPAAGC